MLRTGGLVVALAAAATLAGGGGAVATEVSSNWAGYALTAPAASFTSATATWREPRATCARGGDETAASFWVGLGGYTSREDTLSQIGTTVRCDGGKATHHAWLEVLPAVSVRLPLAIRAGDTITASVNLVDGGTAVLLQLKNRTTRVTATRRLAVSAAGAGSAEWIAEAPAKCSRLWCESIALADFGSVTFERIAAIGAGHPGALAGAAWTSVPIRLVSRPGVQFLPDGSRPDRATAAAGPGAAPGVPAAGGRSFTVTWRPAPPATAL